MLVAAAPVGVPVAVRGISNPPGLEDVHAILLEIEISSPGGPVGVTRLALAADDKPGDAGALMLMTGETPRRPLLEMSLRPADGQLPALYVYEGRAVTLPTLTPLFITAPVDTAWMRLASRRKLSRALEMTLVDTNTGLERAVDLRPSKRPRGADPEREAGESAESLQAQVPALMKANSGELVLPAGNYHLGTDLVVPRAATLVLEAGTTLLLAPGRSIFVYGGLQFRGSADKPVVVAPAGRGPWGVIAILGDAASGMFDHARFIRGSQGIAGAVDLNGTVSVIDARAEFRHCHFERLRGEDAIHAERANVILTHSTFTDLASDGLDLVQASATVSTCRFERLGDDAIDAGHDSTLSIQKSLIRGASGKAVSSGQGSKVTVTDSFLLDSGRGASAFDGGTVTVTTSAIVGSERAAAQASGVRSGEPGNIVLDRCLLWQNGSEGNTKRIEQTNTVDTIPVVLESYVQPALPSGVPIGPIGVPATEADLPAFTPPSGTTPLISGAALPAAGSTPLPRHVWAWMLGGTLLAVIGLLYLERRLRAGR